jgi:uncharacterized membrane protein
VFTVMTGFWLSLNASLAVMPGLLAQRGVRGTKLTAVLVVAYIVLAVVCVIGGAVSQRIGRRFYLMLMSALSAVFGTYFYYRLINTAPENFFTILWLATVTTVLVVAPGALSTVYVYERFTTSPCVRFRAWVQSRDHPSGLLRVLPSGARQLHAGEIHGSDPGGRWGCADLLRRRLWTRDEGR